jgi:hypothetical protein
VNSLEPKILTIIPLVLCFLEDRHSVFHLTPPYSPSSLFLFSILEP